MNTSLPEHEYRGADQRDHPGFEVINLDSTRVQLLNLNPTQPSLQPD